MVSKLMDQHGFYALTKAELVYSPVGPPPVGPHARPVANDGQVLVVHTVGSAPE